MQLGGIHSTYYAVIIPPPPLKNKKIPVKHSGTKSFCSQLVLAVTAMFMDSLFNIKLQYTDH